MRYGSGLQLAARMAKAYLVWAVQVVDQRPLSAIDLELIKALPTGLAPFSHLAQVKSSDSTLLNADPLGKLGDKGGEILYIGCHKRTVASGTQWNKGAR